MAEIIATPTGNDFVTFEITDIAPIAVELPSPKRLMRFSA